MAGNLDGSLSILQVTFVESNEVENNGLKLSSVIRKPLVIDGKHFILVGYCMVTLETKQGLLTLILGGYRMERVDDGDPDTPLYDHFQILQYIM